MARIKGKYVATVEINFDAKIFKEITGIDVNISSN